MASKLSILTSVAVATAAAIFSASAFADVDAVAAKKLARKDHCLRCHAVAKKKEGPSYQSVAYKYKGQADAADKLYTHLTSGEKVKLSDGHEENHKIATAKNDAEIRNLISWILAQ
ncbi:MAG: c-type cytochrome [Rhodocyclaceae bacterium]|nr:c-type cytochrome [Rhodocyclaceae bacterium]